jgi:hypothetical protein
VFVGRCVRVLGLRHAWVARLFRRDFDGGLGRRGETALPVFTSDNDIRAFIIVGVPRPRPPVVWARLCRSRLRLWSAVIALTTAVRVWPGVVGWLVGGFAALGLIFFEFGRWKDYVLDGPETPTEPARLSGSARYRQPGTTRVVLVSVGAHPHLVAMRVRRVAGVDQADAIRIIDRAPTTVVEHISLPSAEKAVAALTAAGAVARLELEQNWSQAAPSP